MGLIAEIKGRLGIEDTLRHFGLSVPSRSRDPVMARCPWHEDRVPSLAVYRRKGRAWCYACNKGGDVLDITALMLNTDIKGAVDYWAGRLRLRSPRREDLRPGPHARIRRLRKACRRASHEIERGMPRPLDPELLSAWDAAYAAKAAVDERAWRDGGPQNKAEAIAYLRELVAWRARWGRLLAEIGGDPDLWTGDERVAMLRALRDRIDHAPTGQEGIGVSFSARLKRVPRPSYL